MVYTDERAIETLEEKSGIKFSDEQLQILKHRGGTQIVACAGSGKTTVITYLVTKRIMTGEIEDPKKLLMTTYSKTGADEMSARINKLLQLVGSDDTVEVKTMHASYYKCLARFGLLKKICSNGQRRVLIKQAIKEAGLPRMEDSDVEEIDTCISYQINNMLSDEQLYNSQAFTVDIRLEDFSNIRMGYARKKEEAGVMDFDDLQYLMYYYLCVVKDPNFVRYCKSQWEYFYVDEFQDTSKIQFKILQALVKDSSKLMVIGDDDQCLVEGTRVRVEEGYKNIEDIKEGDKVISGNGNGGTISTVVKSISSRKINEEIIKITTVSGMVLKGTKKHIGFSRLGERKGSTCRENIEHVLFGSNKVDRYGTNKSLLSIKTSNEKCRDHMKCYYSVKEEKGAWVVKNEIASIVKQEASIREILLNKGGIDLGCIRRAKLNENVYDFTFFGDMRVGMKVPVYKNDGIEEEEIASIEKEVYCGKVYDINVPYTRNFIANDMVVHNCVYQWRGADPSIILNICAYYDLKKFYLSTNYRCRNDILEFAATGVKNMYKREDKNMQAFKPNGVVDYLDIDCTDLYEMAYQTKELIKSDILKGIKPDEIAVLVRNNAHASVLSNMLLLDGIYYKCTEDMKISKSSLYKDLVQLIDMTGDAMSDQCYDKGIASNMLWKLVQYLGVNGASVVYELMDNAGLSLRDAIGVMLQDLLYTDIVGFNKTVKLDKTVTFKLKSRCARIKFETKMALKNLFQILNEGTRKEKLERLIYLYRTGMEFTIKDIDASRSFSCFWRHILNVLKEKDLGGLEQVINMTNSYESGVVESIGDKVTLTTVHSSKGMEWKHVIILAYDNVSFPSFRNITDMIEKRADEEDISSYIDGERRLSYVALTRAIDRLTLVGDLGNFSLYGLEALGFEFGKDSLRYVKLALSKEPVPNLRDEEVYRDYALDLKLLPKEKHSVL